MVRTEPKYWPSSSRVACTAAGALSMKRSLSRVPSSTCCSQGVKASGGGGGGGGSGWARCRRSERRSASGRCGEPRCRATGRGRGRQRRCRPPAPARASRRSRALAVVVDRVTQQGRDFFWTSMTNRALSSRFLRRSLSRVKRAICSTWSRSAAGLGPRFRGARAALLRRLALPAPGAQARRVHPLAAHQRADLAGRAAAEKNRRPRGTTSSPPSAGETFAADAGPSAVALRAPSDAPASARALASSIVALRYRSIVIGYLVAHQSLQGSGAGLIGTEGSMLCAIVAVARKLSGILHRMWIDGTEFQVGFGAKVVEKLRLKPA